MITQRPLFALSFRLMLLVLIGTGLYINLFDGTLAPAEELAYFTIQSNLLAFLFVGYTIFFSRFIPTLGQWYWRIKNAIMMGLFITLVVYTFVLIPYIQVHNIDYEIFGVRDIFVHFLSPLLFGLEIILFSKRGQYDLIQPFFNLSIFIYYFAYVALYVVMGGRFSLSGQAIIFPYFFINFIDLGLWTVLGNVSIVASLAIILGYVFHLFDRVFAVPLR